MNAEAVPTIGMRDPRSMMLMPVAALAISARAQRTIDMNRVAKMSAEWDYDQAEAITITVEPDGKLVVIEGQHRFLALLKRDPAATILCVIVTNKETPAEQAKLALKMVSGRRTTSAFDRHVMAMTAGNPLNIAVASVVDDRGLVVGDRNRHGARVIKGVNTLLSIAKAGGGRYTQEERIERLGEVLDVVLEAWPTDPENGSDERFHSAILRAVGNVLDKGYPAHVIAKTMKRSSGRQGPSHYLSITGGASLSAAITRNLTADLPEL